MATTTDALPIDLDASKHDDEPEHDVDQDEKTETLTPDTAVHVNAQISVDAWQTTGLRNRKTSTNTNNADTPLAPWPAAPQMQMLPSISSSSYDNFEEDDCPATRAAAAVQVLANQPLQLDDDDGEADQIIEHEGQERRLSRMDTAHTSHTSNHSSLDQWNNEELPNSNDVSPKRSNRSYPPDPDSFPNNNINLYTFSPTPTGRILTTLSEKCVPPHLHSTHGGSALAGFLALLLVTMSQYVLGPMRDAAALAVGVSHIPALTLASTVLALGSSVPVGWLFEAPDPRRRRVWKRMGLTRGETQGTSLALFYRVFGFLLWSYAVGFWIVERANKRKGVEDSVDMEGEVEEESLVGWVGILVVRLLHGFGVPVEHILNNFSEIVGECFGIPSFLASALALHKDASFASLFIQAFTVGVNKFASIIYIMFFLVVHLMKLHSLSLIWGVTTEAMEYEENAERRRKAMEEKKEEMMSMTKRSSAGGLVMCGSSGGFGKSHGDNAEKNPSNAEKNQQQGSGGSSKPSHSALRLKRLGFVGFGGTLGGILGSLIASFTAHILNLSGLLILAAVLLEISANLSIELGRIMQRHWEEQMKFTSCGDLASLSGSEVSLNGSNIDSSMKKSVSLGSMKRVASSQGNLSQFNNTAQPAKNSNSGGMTRAKSIGTLNMTGEEKAKLESEANDKKIIDDNSFKQRLLRGVTTILRSRLLMAIFTYNALYASTSVLLSFQRAELVVNRSSTETSAVSNTAFLAKINTASSVAVFALQASGLGALIASSCGQRGALALMPLIRLGGVILLGWWHWWSRGQPPDLMLFLIIDEFTKVINFAIAKPVRENLWRGLSAEARYEAKPIVDTLANRWGGGSAAFLVSFISRIAPLLGVGEVDAKGEMTIFGFPPVLLLCIIISAWWTAVSADVGNIRSKIDMELKKQQ